MIPVNDPSDFQASALSERLDALVIRRDGFCERCGVEVLLQNVLEVRINDAHAMSVSCTCCDVFELVVGRLLSEGYIAGAQDIEALSFDEKTCAVDVRLKSHCPELTPVNVEEIVSTGSRGNILKPAFPSTDLDPYSIPKWNVDELFALRDLFSEDTPMHSRTSGTHSCRLAIDGKVAYLAEDIGRHNALDKAIGWALLNGVDMSRTVFFISGRIPIDMAIKAVRSKIPVLVSKAAPTGGAVRLARRYGLGLMCFPDEQTLRVFSNGGEGISSCSNALHW